MTDIIALITEFGITFDGEHVKIHQKLKLNEEVPLEIQLKEDCDHYRYAKDFLRNTPEE